MRRNQKQPIMGILSEVRSLKLLQHKLMARIAQLLKAKGATLAAPFKSMAVSLECELQTKLNQPWIGGRGNATEVRTANASIRVAEVSVIEDIEELSSEFNELVLTYSGSLNHRKVEVDRARSVENVATEVSESACPIEQSSCIRSANSTEERISSRCGCPTARSIKEPIRTTIGGVRISRIKERDRTCSDEVWSITAGAGE